MVKVIKLHRTQLFLRS